MSLNRDDHENLSKYGIGTVISLNTMKKHDVEFICITPVEEKGNTSPIVFLEKERVEYPKLYYMSREAFALKQRQGLKAHDMLLDMDVPWVQFSIGEGGVVFAGHNSLMPNREAWDLGLTYILSSNDFWKDRVPAKLAKNQRVYYASSKDDDSGWKYSLQDHETAKPVSGWELGSRVISYHLSENSKIYAVTLVVKYQPNGDVEYSYVLQPIMLAGHAGLEPAITLDKFAANCPPHLSRHSIATSLGTYQKIRLFNTDREKRYMEPDTAGLYSRALGSNEPSKSMESTTRVNGMTD